MSTLAELYELPRGSLVVKKYNNGGQKLRDVSEASIIELSEEIISEEKVSEHSDLVLITCTRNPKGEPSSKKGKDSLSANMIRGMVVDPHGASNIIDGIGEVVVRSFPCIESAVVETPPEGAKYSMLPRGVLILVSYVHGQVMFTTNTSLNAKRSRFGTKKTFYDMLVEILGEDQLSTMLADFFADAEGQTKVHYLVVSHPEIISSSRIPTEGFIYYIGSCDRSEYIKDGLLTHFVKPVLSQVPETLSSFPPLAGVVPFFWLTSEAAQQLLDDGEGLLVHSDEGPHGKVYRIVSEFGKQIADISSINNNITQQFAIIRSQQLSPNLLKKLTGTESNDWMNKCLAVINSLPPARRCQATRDLEDFMGKVEAMERNVKSIVGRNSCQTIIDLTNDDLKRIAVEKHGGDLDTPLNAKYAKDCDCLGILKKMAVGARNTIFKRLGKHVNKDVYGTFMSFLSKQSGLSLYKLVKHFDPESWK